MNSCSGDTSLKS